MPLFRLPFLIRPCTSVSKTWALNPYGCQKKDGGILILQVPCGERKIQNPTSRPGSFALYHLPSDDTMTDSAQVVPSYTYNQ
jgi:hypothetical protein